MSVVYSEVGRRRKRMGEEDVLGAISEATEAIRIQSSKIDALIRLNERMVQWLLAVVCAIALGKELINAVRQALSH